jgi:lipopolysaccharide/colanic/teichoic acid biosynthesis glycosyltransferase
MQMQLQSRSDPAQKEYPPPHVRPAAHPAPRLYLSIKVAFDFALALVLLALASPLLVLLALLVKLTSRGPVLYSQMRLGKNGRPFRIYKFRTMAHDCERHSGPRWSTPGDPRVTPLGRFLRRAHLDELPQLWNVLKGDMALVGPRPERPEFVPQLERAIPRYRERLAVRPGLTGLAQVRLPADTDLDSVRRKLVHDLHYIHRLGFWLDFRILLCTAFKVLHLPFSASAWIIRVPDEVAGEQAHRFRFAET